MIHLRLSDSTQVDGTATHRFWSVTRGDWFGARDLRVGESLRTPSGTVRVDEARVEAVLTPVFNLEVEGAHEFFVGDAEVLAHNGRLACDFGPVEWTSPDTGVVHGPSRFQATAFEGRRGYKNFVDIDPGVPSVVNNRERLPLQVQRILDDGGTNAQLMRRGYAPIGRDGHPMELHHVIGEEPGPVVELTQTMHDQLSRPLHGMIQSATRGTCRGRPMGSFPASLVDDAWR